MIPLPNASDSLYVFIMAGGSGERFWPMSRSQFPKHLLRLLGERTLLEETVLRAQRSVPRSEEHTSELQSQR